MLDNKKLQSQINLYTILLFVLLSIIPLFDAGFDNNLVPYMMIPTLMVLFIKNNLYKKDLILNYKDPIFFYSLYLLWSALSFFWSIYYIRTVMELFELLLYGFIFYISSQLEDEDNYKVISVVLLVASGIALLGVGEYIFINNKRVVASFTNPNPFASYLLMLFLFSWGLALRNKDKRVYLSSFIFLTTLLLSGSRGGLFATMLAFPLVFLEAKKKESKDALLKTFTLVALALMTTKILIYIAPLIQNKMGTSQNLLESLLRKETLVASSLLGRLEFWKVAWELIKNRTLRGYGLGSFFSAYYIEYMGNRWYSRFVHNHYLQIWAETGLVGILLFLSFLFSVFKIIVKKFKIGRNLDYLPGAIAAIVGFLLHIGAEFSFNYPGASIIFFWILGMSIRKTKTESRKLNFNLTYKYKNIILILISLLLIYNLSFFKLYNQASSYALEGRKDKALKLVEFSNKYYPISPYGFKLEGEYYWHRYQKNSLEKDKDKAISLYKNALAIASHDGGLHNTLGGIYYKSGDLAKGEEHLKLGARYAAYNINPYLDLTMFYLNENRMVDAEKTLLAAADLKEYAIGSASSEEKDSMIINAMTIHGLLYNIYQNNGDKIKLKGQVDELNRMMEDYPSLKNYFDIKTFK